MKIIKIELGKIKPNKDKTPKKRGVTTQSLAKYPKTLFEQLNADLHNDIKTQVRYITENMIIEIPSRAKIASLKVIPGRFPAYSTCMAIGNRVRKDITCVAAVTTGATRTYHIQNTFQSFSSPFQLRIIKVAIFDALGLLFFVNEARDERRRRSEAPSRIMRFPISCSVQVSAKR